MFDPVTFLPVLILKYYAVTIWFFYSLNVVIGLFGIGYEANKNDKKASNVDIVIVSLASKGVRNSLFECINHVRRNFAGVHIHLVIDEGAELTDDLKTMCYGSGHDSEVNGKGQLQMSKDETKDTMTNMLFSLVIVPKAYRPDLIGKGRAMNFFIEDIVAGNKWYAFIDDDNLILDDQFMYEVPYYETRGYVAANPILIPRPGKNKIAFVMDWIRYFDDVTIFRLFTGRLKRPLIGLHGEMLCAKGNVLKEIGYGRRTIVEDFGFAAQLAKRKLKTWQSATKVSIKSPNNITDLCKQRGRWFRGIWTDIKVCPPVMKVVVAIRLIGWTNGFIGSWALSPIWIIWPVDLWILIGISIGGIYIWMIFIFAIIKTKSPLYYVLAIPIFGFIEAISIYVTKRKKGFVVIDKN